MNINVTDKIAAEIQYPTYRAMDDSIDNTSCSIVWWTWKLTSWTESNLLTDFGTENFLYEL